MSTLCWGWVQTWELGSAQSGFSKALGCRCPTKALAMPAEICQLLPSCSSFEAHFLRPNCHFGLNLVEIGHILCYFHRSIWSTLPYFDILTIFISNWLFCIVYSLLWCQLLSVSVKCPFHFLWWVHVEPWSHRMNPFCLWLCVKSFPSNTHTCRSAEALGMQCLCVAWEARQALTRKMHAQKLIPLMELKERCNVRFCNHCSCAPGLQHIGNARGAEWVCPSLWPADWDGWKNSSMVSGPPAQAVWVWVHGHKNPSRCRTALYGQARPVSWPLGKGYFFVNWQEQS